MFGSFRYVVPDDKERQLYDFYMLNFLVGRSKFDSMRGMKTSKFDSGEMDEEDQLDHMLDEVKHTLLPTLQKNLLDAVFFSLAAEFRHMFDLKTNITTGAINSLEPDDLKIIRDYAKNLGTLKVAPSLFRPTRQSKKEIEEIGESGAYEIDYKNSYKCLLKTGASKGKLVVLMRTMFSLPIWKTSYGGTPWANIASGWIKLANAQTEMDKFIYIDHIYDLQHNTDTVFNKLESYQKNSSYQWLKNALNHKAKIKSPHEIIDKISPAFKKLALRTIKMKMGMTYEDFMKQKTKERWESQKNIPSSHKNAITAANLGYSGDPSGKFSGNSDYSPERTFIGWTLLNTSSKFPVTTMSIARNLLKYKIDVHWEDPHSFFAIDLGTFNKNNSTEFKIKEIQYFYNQEKHSIEYFTKLEIPYTLLGFVNDKSLINNEQFMHNIRSWVVQTHPSVCNFLPQIHDMTAQKIKQIILRSHFIEKIPAIQVFRSQTQWSPVCAKKYIEYLMLKMVSDLWANNKEYLSALFMLDLEKI